MLALVVAEEGISSDTSTVAVPAVEAVEAVDSEAAVAAVVVLAAVMVVVAVRATRKRVDTCGTDAGRRWSKDWNDRCRTRSPRSRSNERP